MKLQYNFHQPETLLLALVFFFTTSVTCVAQSFITTWKTDNIGISDSTSITIPTIGSGYNYDVDWDNDGVFDEFGITGDVTHDFGVTGTYTIAIQGDFPRIYFNDSLDKEKIIEINQWGNNVWTSMEKAFYGCKNLDGQILDAPNLSMVTDMSYMFANAHSFDQPIGSWDVSNVTNMSYLFFQTPFNQSLNSWNVSTVTDMSFMFYGTFFNQDISSWNVSNVTNMSGMFYGAVFFNQDISSWNVSNVTNMSEMFYSPPLASSDFNQSLDLWNVSNVTDMSFMFFGANTFNQPLDTWNVSNVTDMKNMFSLTPFFNQSLNNWNVSNVTDMGGMFYASGFNQPLDNWNVSNVTDISSMFSFTFFNQPLNTWDVSNVTDMAAMFFGANAFNQSLNSWNVSNVTDMSWMFTSATAFNQPLGTWNVSNVTDMTNMLSNSNLSVSNYDSTLIGWESQGIMNKNLGADSLTYCTSDSIRNNLINLNGWTITGDTIDDISCKTVSTTSLSSFDIFEIYPNPTNGLLFINVEFETPLNNVQVAIINTNGQIIQTVNLGNNINIIQEKIDLTNLPKGSYYILLRSNTESIGKMILLN